MTRKALGRGLNALLREVEAPPASVGVEQIAVNLIDPNPFQPRHTFPESGLTELADSIRSSGIVQPVLARRAGERYQLVAGERRWRAAMLAGLESIPAIVRALDDSEALWIALTENLLREDLNALEVAKAYEQLQGQFNMTHEQIAQRLGVNRSTVTNALRLLSMHPEVQQLVADGKLSAGHARALAGLDSHEAQRQFALLALRRGFSVRQLEHLTASASRPPRHRDAAARKPTDPNVRFAVLEIERILGTRVKVLGDGKRGRLEISYYSPEDLNRIYELIVRK
jgi:ParB family chromosome partitioning protein